MHSSPSIPAFSVNSSDQAQSNTPEPARIHQDKPPASKTTSSTTVYFQYRGRQWRLFKRDPRPAASWYLYFESARKRHLYSLGTASKQHAVAEAKLKLDLHFERREDDLRRSMVRPSAPQYATIAEVLQVAPSLPIDAGLATRNSYAWSLRWVLRMALQANDAAILRQSAAILSDDTARRYFERVTAHAGTLPPAKAETFKRTAITFYDNARALFAPRALNALVHTFNLALPSLDAWRRGKVHAPATTGASEFVPPPDAVVRRTLTEWIRLARSPGYSVPGTDATHGDPLSDTDRRNMFVAIGLMLSFGFRKSDAVRARWSWFDRDEAGPLCRVTGTTQKNKQNSLEISAVDPFWSVLNFWLDKNGWRGAPDGHCLIARPQVKGEHSTLNFARGGVSDRNYWPFWLVGKWLRSLGWTTQKTNHALRDLVASKLTMKYGLDGARDWCRHAQQSTTERHYNRFRRRGEQIDRAKLAWLRWAK